MNKNSVNYSKKPTEADMRSRYIDPILDGKDGSWDPQLVDREHTYDAGQLVPEFDTGETKRKDPIKKPDYILKLSDDYNIAIIEAKSSFKNYDEGIQQAIDYAEDLHCKFAYATNGKAINKEKNTGIKEYDFITKQYSERGNFPTLEELKSRLLAVNDVDFANNFGNLIAPLERPPNKPPLRYYQRSAINTTIEAINQGRKKILLNLATGTGKTKIAYQISRKLWQYYKDENGNSPKILFIADRSALLTQAMTGEFEPFKGKMHRLIGKKETAFDIYFTLYQSLDVEKEDNDSESSTETELYKLYDRDFFNYVIIDECHRGASTQGGKWRDILDYFKDSVHIGMTATPKRDADSQDTYSYFGKPIYIYSAKQGVEDGFLAPHFLEEIHLKIDGEGYMPEPNEKSRSNKPLERRRYTVEEYDSVITIIERQKKVAKTILDFLNKPPNTKYDKTILFCRDQKHASEMRDILVNMSKEGKDYCVRITSNEGEIGKSQLDKFCNPKDKFPVIAVTSKLMTTGVDAQTCKLIVLDTFVKSQTELKQIVGRGTRVYESKSIKKYYFTIMDFRGSTAQFRDPGWDGEPVPKKYPKPSRGKKRESKEPTERIIVDGKPVEISGRTVKVYDPSQPSGHQFLGYKEYIGKTVRELSGEMIEDFKNLWINLEDHKKLVKKLEERRITPDRIRELTNLYEADIFDILVNLAYEKPIKSRHQRAYLVMKDKPFFAKYPEKAREVLTILLDHYAEYGYEELEDRSVLELTKFKKFNGTRNILTNIFSNPKEYDKAVQDLIVNIYEK
jgi:type I restriction enzyme R subunit